MAHTTTGTASATLPGASSAGTLLVAQCGASGTAGTWTVPTNWVAAAAVTVVNGTTVNNLVLAYLLPSNNPGGLGSSFSFTFGTSTINAQAAEFNPPASTTVAANATGSGTAGAVSSLAISTTTGATAGDLAICGFQLHLTAAAVTWTDPSGWTLLDDTTASAGNQEYAAYLLSAGAGTLSLTGTSSGTGLANGWTGAVITFTATASNTPVSDTETSSGGESVPAFIKVDDAQGFP